MRVLPCPDIGFLCAFLQSAVCFFLRIDQRDVSVVGFRLFIQQCENTVRAGETHNHHVDLVGNLADGTCKLLGHVQEGNHDADAECQAGNADIGSSCQQQAAADQSHDYVNDVSDVAEQRHQNVGISVCLFGILKQFIIYLIKISLGAFLMAENLDDLLTVHHLLYKAFRAGDGNLLLKEVAGGMSADVPGDKGHDHHAADNYQREPEAVIQHDAENADQGDCGNHQLRETLADHLTQRINIIGIKAHDIAVIMRIKIADGQILHVIEHLFTELCQRSLGDDSHQLSIKDVGKKADRIQSDQKGQQSKNGSGSRGPVSAFKGVLHDGNGVLHEHRRNGAHNCIDENADQRDRKKHRIKAEYGADQAGKNALGRASAACGGFGGIICHPCHLLLDSGMYKDHDKPHWMPGAPHEYPLR